MKKSDKKKSRILLPDGANAELEEPGDEQKAPPETEAQPPLQERVEQLTDALARAKADFANLQKRTAIEMSDAMRFANAGLMKSLLNVLDDFDRAIDAETETGRESPFLEGVRLVRANLFRALQAQGLEAIQARHQPFDPARHEALMQAPTADHPPGTVTEVVNTGYRLHDRVIRPAKVIVAKAPEEAAADAATKE